MILVQYGTRCVLLQCSNLSLHQHYEATAGRPFSNFSDDGVSEKRHWLSLPENEPATRSFCRFRQYPCPLHDLRATTLEWKECQRRKQKKTRDNRQPIIDSSRNCKPCYCTAVHVVDAAEYSCGSYQCNWCGNANNWRVRQFPQMIIETQIHNTQW